MPTSTAGKSTNHGFTLIELAVVILIIALFSAITVPLISGAIDDGMRTSARRLVGTAKHLYNEAALNRLEYRLIFNVDEGTYRAQRLEANGELVDVEGLGRRRQLKGETRFQDVQVAGRGRWSSGEVTMGIHPGGWLEETVIHLHNGKGKVLTLRVMPFTGSTEVYDGYREF
jgi:prepilin-type N-terminal cleavage/methylation domain-containing protein